MIDRLKSNVRALLGRKDPGNIFVTYVAKKQWLTIHDFGGYQSRNSSTIHLLLMAMETAKKDIKRNFTAAIFTDDFDDITFTRPHFAYCANASSKNTIVIPDFMFCGWPEVGVSDYEDTIDKMISASKSQPQDPRLFWIGNVATHKTRSTFMELSHKDKRICAAGIDWLHGSFDSQAGRQKTKDDVFVSIPDHCKYKYLIDLQGLGFSARLKLLMFSGRPLFVQERQWHQYYFNGMKPFEHFIPVREDLSDLPNMLDWAESHPHEAQRIAESALEYASTHLRRRHAVARFHDCLIQIAAM